jgi:hypothetical protein
MNMDSTPEERKQYFVQLMGEELGSYFNLLDYEVRLLYAKWNEYVVLFGKNKEIVDLLNKAAPLFFYYVQETMFDDTILHIARLTEREELSGQKNLTIQGLKDRVVKGEIESVVEKLTEEAKDKAGICKKIRNKTLAHRDIKWAKKKAHPLNKVSRKQVKKAIDAIAAVLKAIWSHYKEGSKIEFKMTEKQAGAYALLYVIDDYLDANEELKKQFMAGKVEYNKLDKPRFWDDYNWDETYDIF